MRSAIDDALEILGSRATMAISTVRPDGWPQTTIVGFANDGFVLYFMIFRTSQKFANIAHDNRVSLAVEAESEDVAHARAVYAGAYAAEVTDPRELERAWDLLARRHPNLRDFDMPDTSRTAIMRAECKHVSVVDYTKGLGHTESLTIGEDAGPASGRRKDSWDASTPGAPQQKRKGGR